MSGVRLSDTEQAALSALLNVVIPPEPTRGLPGAGEIAFPDYAHGKALEEFLRDGLARLEKESPAPFVTLTPEARVDAVHSLEKNHTLFFRAFMKHAVQCYYQDDRVLTGIGSEPRPPFPDGFRVDDGDLTLLAPVLERGNLYRS